MLLLVSSTVFYSIGGVETIAVPIIIIISTFVSAILIERNSDPGIKKRYFWLGLIINLGLLVFFKYINFFIATVFDGFEIVKKISHEGLVNTYQPIELQLIVPLGISYITFQAIGYLIEIKRGIHIAEKNLGHFATYLMFFPKLLSGPIERAHNFLPQLQLEHKFDYKQVVQGLKRILWGLFLKVAIANRLALYTSAVLDNSEHHTGTTLLIAALFYTLQMFTDFSGYTDMAIGSAQLFGYKLTENFNAPFSAKSMADFWRKWHITLSSWVNDYIYTPIVINKRDWGKSAVVYAGMVTFLILGFWHGASWNYIIFGFLQGVILAIEFLTRKTRKKMIKHIPNWLNSIIGMCYTFLFFTFSLIFFRAYIASDGFYIVSKIFTDLGTTFYMGDIGIFSYSLIGILIIAIQGIVSVYYPKFKLLNHDSRYIRFLTILFLIVYIISFGVFDGGQFIYFQF
ncbi:MBOAT family O-acyltransferase [Aureibaculum sp. 2210JD6-5]|uniref:MBOAT family O-acyltransferase n=1 Tax=Aureibaculum sp. 2210JD6-5 TaxID=3103957 RepID=UPI002AAE55E9|nr:MBOAT family O-acyltransferase [Aureibaculum sp. 2210JD6-5]MDY7394010.1 MBOAT family O-acyltransferase [Aureibaculum sp. 2210JD6-5]